MKLLKLAGLSLCAGIAALSVDVISSVGRTEAVAQQLTLDQVLSAVRKERRESAEANRQREAQFLAERNSQRAQVAEVKRQKDAAKAETTRLEGVRDANRTILADLTAELDEKNAEYRDLFGAARSAANELRSAVQSSLISSEFPGRADPLQKMAINDSLPAIEELENLWDTYLKEIVQQGKVSTYTAPVVGADGDTGKEKEVTRVGPFIAVSGGEFLVYKTNSAGISRLEELARQPSGGKGALASNIEGLSGGNYSRGVIDPSLGTLLSLSVDEPTLNERIEQGGTVGYIIIGIAILGILIGIYKLVTLTLVNGAVSAQGRSKRAGKGNPLGRVMMAYEATNTADTETVSLRIDDAVLKEIPKLESGLNFIKVLAAVAPLLGLLGTVIGMIQTFQQITLFGTGDPQIMAGGISTALMTTVQGLVAAIPLLLLHSFASGAARNVSQTLEQKAAGIIAQHAEGRG